MNGFPLEKRRLRLAGCVLPILLLMVAGAAGFRAYRAAAKEDITVLTRPEAGKCTLGTALVLEWTFRVPWGQSMAKAAVQTAPGWVAAAPPEISAGKWRWGGTEKTMRLTLRAYRPGNGSPGTLTVPFRQPFRRSGGQAPEVLILPDFTVTAAPVDPQAELPLADALKIPAAPHYGRVIAGGVLLVLLLIALFFLFRRRKSPPPPPAWEIAARDLAVLRCDAASGGHSTVWCFTRLTDVVRDYLTRRFQLRADRQTTEEFLHSLSGDASPLTPEQEHTLESFLKQADLIKFAGQTPEAGAFDHAITHAEELVRVTTPAPGTPDSRKESVPC